MSESPWYQNGLHFKCTECGKCCTGSPGYVWVTEQDMTNMAAVLNTTLELFKRRYVRMRDNRYALIEKKAQSGDFDCIFLKDKKCMVYQARPVQCRTYPWWKENLRTPESWKLASEGCEGINDAAPIVPFEQIERMVSANEVTI